MENDPEVKNITEQIRVLTEQLTRLKMERALLACPFAKGDVVRIGVDKLRPHDPWYMQRDMLVVRIQSCDFNPWYEMHVRPRRSTDGVWGDRIFALMHNQVARLYKYGESDGLC